MTPEQIEAAANREIALLEKELDAARIRLAAQAEAQPLFDHVVAQRDELRAEVHMLNNDRVDVQRKQDDLRATIGAWQDRAAEAKEGQAGLRGVIERLKSENDADLAAFIAASGDLQAEIERLKTHCHRCGREFNPICDPCYRMTREEPK